MNSVCEFDYKKATQAINYLARREGGQIDKLKLIKLIYLAERYHLRRHGRPIVNDTYVAMKFGPVASSVKDIAEMSSDFLDDQEKAYAQAYIQPNGRSNIHSLAEVDDELFSDSELEALDFAYSEFGSLHQLKLVDLTHEYPEWKQFEAALKAGASRELMSYRDFFKDPEGLVEDKFALPADLLAASQEMFEEEQKRAQYWK